MELVKALDPTTPFINITHSNIEHRTGPGRHKHPDRARHAARPRVESCGILSRYFSEDIRRSRQGSEILCPVQTEQDFWG